jgi:hypothetical protein
MSDTSKTMSFLRKSINRRSALKGLAATSAVMAGPGFVRYSQAQSSAPIKIGFQAHRTGIGASYGRWYERTTTRQPRRSTTRAASMAVRSKSSPKTMAPTPSAGPKWWKNSPTSTRPTSSTARCSAMW